MPKVLNKYTDVIPENAVYIGRGSPYGNPFIIDVHGNREKVIQLYRNAIDQDKELIQLIKRTLKGKDLVCFCAPKPCHGDYLLKIANGK